MSEIIDWRESRFVLESSRYFNLERKIGGGDFEIKKWERISCGWFREREGSNRGEREVYFCLF